MDQNLLGASFRKDAHDEQYRCYVDGWVEWERERDVSALRFEGL